MATPVNHAEASESPIYEQSGNPNRAMSPSTGSMAPEIAIATPPKKASVTPKYGDELSKGSDSLPMTEANKGPNTIETVWMKQDWASMKDMPKREGSKSLPVEWPKQ